MGFVYKATNKINGKSYVGITRVSVDWRWNAHICSAFTESYKDHDCVFHKAIRKYGIDSFYVETVEESNDEDLPNLERKYIELFDTFLPNGYNMTRGGDGHWTHDYNEIMRLWNEGYSQCEIVMLYSRKIARNTIAKILRINGVSEDEICERSNVAIARSKIKRVYQYDRNTGDFIKTHYSVSEAAKEVGGNLHNIAQSARGSTKSSYGYLWSFKKVDRMEPIRIDNNGSHLIGRYDLNGNIEEIYTSATAASRNNGIERRKMTILCDNKAEYNGKIWKYIDTTGGIIHVK